MRHTGRIALVTGAAQGIGLACVEQLIASGAKVMMSDINAKALATAHAKQPSASADFAFCDVADTKSGQELVAQTVARFGAIDILVNNAGIIDTADFLDLSIEEFDRILSVNLRGGFVIAQAAAKAMVQQAARGRQPGAIINMSSANAHFGLPDHVAYSISKGGMSQLTKAAAISLAPHGIRVNAVGPGTINTDIVKAVADNPAALTRILSRTPLGRFGEPSEIATIVDFLASTDASYITGQTIFPDGGRMFLNYTVPVKPSGT